MLAGELEVLGRLRLTPGELIVARDRVGARAGIELTAGSCRERLRDAAMEQASSREARILVDDRPHLLVAEVVCLARLSNQPAARELLERRDDLVVAAPARLPNRL